VVDWFGGEESVPELIQRKKYRKAERLLRDQFQAGRRDADLRLQLADVLVLDGRGGEAVPIYMGLADELARGGHGPRAIAVLKKIERVAPGRGDVADRIARLLGDGGAAAAAVEPPPPPDPIPAPLEPAAPVAVPPIGILASPLFGDFTSEDLRAVIGGLQLLTFDPGDIIVGDGDEGDSLFVIGAGRVKAFVKGEAGRYRRAREMGEGEFFGEIALLYGRPRTATVTAAERCELLRLERATVESLAATRPRVREVLDSFCAARAASTG